MTRGNVMRASHIALLCTTALAGCGTPSLPIAQQWGKTISQFSLLPLYPLQEDVQPGDVYLLGADGRNSDSNWRIPVQSFPRGELRDALCKGYGSRLAVEPAVLPSGDTTNAHQAGAPPASPPATAQDIPQAKAQQPKAAAANAAPAHASAAPPPQFTPCAQPGGAIAVAPHAAKPAPGTPTYDIGAATDDAAPLRMHTVALPILSVARYTSADLSGGGSVGGGATLSGAVGGSGGTAVDITLDNVEEMHIPEADVLDAVRDHQVEFLARHLPPTHLIRLLAQKSRDYAKAFCATDFTALDQANISLLVVNEVVYAHTVDYSYAQNATFAASLAAQLAAPAGLSPSVQTPTNPPAARPAANNQSGNNQGGNNQPAADGAQNAGAPAGNLSPAQTQLQGTQTQLQTALQALNAAASQSTAGNPGVQAKFGISKTGNLTLHKTSERPLAFGFAGSLHYTMGDLAATYHLLFTHPEDMEVSAQDQAFLPLLQATYRRVGPLCAYYGGGDPRTQRLASLLLTPDIESTDHRVSPAITPLTPSIGVKRFPSTATFR